MSCTNSSSRDLLENGRPGAIRLLPWFIVVAVVVSYLNSFSNPFIFDDWNIIRYDPGISMLWSFSFSSRFIADITFKLNYALGGFNVADYHATNMIIHLIAGLLLYGIIRRTLLLPVFASKFQSSAPWLAAACASLWSVHPLQTESVTYICQRYESLTGMFLFLCLYSFVRAQSSALKRLWCDIALAACVLGMGSKQSMVIAPFIVILYDHIFLSRSFRDLLRERWKLHAALFLTLGILPMLHLNSVRAVIQAGEIGLKAQPVSPLTYLFTQFGVILHYLKLSVVPYPLCLDYAWPVAIGWREITIPGVLVAVLLAATYCTLRRRQPAGFIGAWFFITLLPASGLVPIADMAAERRMYLPLAAVVCFAVLAYCRFRCAIFGRLQLRRALDIGVFVGVAGMFCFLTIERNADYGSEKGMLGKIAAARPHNFRAQIGFTSCLLADDKLDEADAAARLLLHRLDSAAADKSIRYRRTAAGNVEFYIPEAHDQYGRVLLAKGKVREAIAEFNEAVRLRPDCQAYYNNLALAVFFAGDLNAAIKICETAIAVDPAYAKAYALLGYIMARQGRHAEAEAYYRKALKLDSNQVSAESELAWLLATSPVDDCRNGFEALSLALSVCEATGYRSIRALDVLAAAYAEKGEYSTAIQTAQKALKLAREMPRDGGQDVGGSVITGQTVSPSENHELSIAARLAIYENHKPYREAIPVKMPALTEKH